MRIVDAQTQEAAAKKQVVEGEEAIASEKAAAAKAIKVRHQLQLSAAMAWLLCWPSGAQGAGITQQQAWMRCHDRVGSWKNTVGRGGGCSRVCTAATQGVAH